MVKFVFFALIFLFTTSAYTSEPKGLHAYIAAGNNFVFPGSIRIGWNQWEYGKLNSNMYGASKLLFFKPNYYTSFGFGAAGNANHTNLAFTASIGFLYDMLWGLGFRGELAATANVSGWLSESGNIGFSYDF